MIDEFDVDFSNKIATQNSAMTFSCFKSVLFFPFSSDYIYKKGICCQYSFVDVHYVVIEI